MPKTGVQPKQRARGFLLLVVVGLLALLLMLCIGLLSRTSSEIDAVKHVRNKVDSRNLTWSATDWIIGCIGAGLFDAGGNVDATKFVTRCSDKNSTDYNWWYKPYFVADDFAVWHPSDTSYKIANAAKWIYMPEDFFPAGDAVRARFFVQVLDTNAYINANDWLEDCGPTQCQMAHMLIDAMGPGPIANAQAGYRRVPATPDPANFPAPRLKANGAGFLITDTTQPNDYRKWPSLVPPRYEQAFNIGSRTLRVNAEFTVGTNTPWQTTNTTSFSMWPVERSIMPPSVRQYNLVSSAGMGPATSLSKYAYSDPDTGRCPVNVNTCENSGEQTPHWYGCRSRTLEGVFNVEALRRIIRIGWYESASGKLCDLSDANVYRDFYEPNPSLRLLGNPNYPIDPALRLPADPIHASPPDDVTKPQLRWVTFDDWRRVEIAKTKLAYQYQETLLRYFSATYYYANTRGADLQGNTNWYNSQYPMFGRTYASVASLTPAAQTNRTYLDTYSIILGAPEAALVTSYCKTFDNSKARFPYGVEEFRRRVKTDLYKMCENNRNIYPRNLLRDGTGKPKWMTYRHPNFPGATDYDKPGPSNDGIAYVGVDKDFNLEILPGKLDYRTAAAIYDNIVPGKAFLFPKLGAPGEIDEPAIRALLQARYPTWAADPVFDPRYVQVLALAGAPQNRLEEEIKKVRNPLWDLYAMQRLGREENGSIEPHMDVLGHVPTWQPPLLPWKEGWNGPPTWNVPPAAPGPEDQPLLTYNHKKDGVVPEYNWGVDIAEQPQFMTIVAGDGLPGPYLRCNKKDIRYPLQRKGKTPELSDRMPPVLPPDDGPGPLADPLTADQRPNVPYTVVPYRQLCFGPDWFSTELTTTTTNFAFVVHTQLVEPNGNFANPRILTEYVVQLYVELAPDILVEDTGDGGDILGLHYYRDGKPAYYKTAPATSTDSMDYNCMSLASSVDPAALPATVMRQTSLPLEWVDYRGISDPATFYKAIATGGSQTKKRVIIRYIGDQNQGQNNGYAPN